MCSELPLVAAVGKRCSYPGRANWRLAPGTGWKERSVAQEQRVHSVTGSWLNFLCGFVFYITWILKSDLIKDNLFQSLSHFVSFHWIMQRKRESEEPNSTLPGRAWLSSEVESCNHHYAAACFSCIFKNMTMRPLWRRQMAPSLLMEDTDVGLHTLIREFVFSYSKANFALWFHFDNRQSEHPGSGCASGQGLGVEK